LQINFTWDHEKILICPLTQSVTVFEKNKMRTYRYCDLRGKKISKILHEKLEFALKKIDEVISSLKI
jgi:hypothetical protein